MKFLNTKWFPWLIVAVLAIGTVSFTYHKSSKYNSDLSNYQKQLAGLLSDKERALETANKDLGTANSKLVKALSDKDVLTKEFEQFKKDNQLILKSKDEIIATLQSQITGGQSSSNSTCVLPSGCVISYSWKDDFGRFELKVPDVFAKPSVATFTANQSFILKGQVYKQKNGFLETRRVELQEVYLDGKDYKTVPGSSANIVDSQFQYTDQPPASKSIFSPRLFLSLGYDFNSIKAGIGAQFIFWRGFGLESHTAFDKTLKNSTQSLGLLWTPFDSWNFGIGPSVSTPFNNLFHSWALNLNVVFYLNE